jgi:uncharacterized protein (TIGR02145 family)
MYKKIGFFALMLAVVSSCYSQTNRGTEFWCGYGHHQYMEQPCTDGGASGNNSQNMVLYFVTGNQQARVKVFIGNQLWYDSLIGPNASASTSTIPKSGNLDARLFTSPCSFVQNANTHPNCNGEGIFKDTNILLLDSPQTFAFYKSKAIKVISDAPIVAYEHIYGSVSSGATMLLPVEAWGSKYYTINTRQGDDAGIANCYSWFYVIAKHNNTRIRITPAQNTRRSNSTRNFLTGENSPYGIKDVPYEIVLNEGQIYQAMGGPECTPMKPEMTGTVIESIPNENGQSFPIAVFAGSSRTGNSVPATSQQINEPSINCNPGGRDNDQQQCFPTKAWGKNYILTPLANKLAGNTTMTNSYKIVVMDTNTILQRRINGVWTIVPQTKLIDRKYYQLVSIGVEAIKADRPIMVAQFMTGGCLNGGMGDPEMIYISPIEQSIKSASFIRQSREAIRENYLVLSIPETGLNSLRIDGQLNNWTYAYSDTNAPGYKIVVKAWSIGAGQGFQSTVSSDFAFNAVTYGLGGAESYGFNVGSGLTNLNEICVANILNNDTTICQGQSILLNGVGSQSVTDIDGNVYPTVNIGNQTWTQKNLNVSRYRNGDVIPQVTNPTQWANLTTGAWCYYNNDSANGAIYGKLYNWYAVNDPRGLAPLGWAVPVESNWNRLVKFIDPNTDTSCLPCLLSSSAGGAMKSANGWSIPSVGASNSSGFFGFPGGYRGSNGAYDRLGFDGIWWSSTEFDDTSAWLTNLNHGSIDVYRGESNKSFGISVRLISNNTGSNTSLLWSTGATTPSITITPTQSTTYYLTATSGNTTCRDSVRVNVTQINNNFFPQDTIRTCGTAYALTAGPTFTAYNWNTGDAAPSIIVRNSGWYRCTVRSGSCFATDSVYIEFIRANITNNDTTICLGASVVLNGTGFGSYLWSTGAITSSISVSPFQSATYQLGVTSGTVTCRDSVRVTVIQFNNNPIALENATGCKSYIISTQGSYDRYVWSNGGVTPTLTVNQPGWYKLIAIKGNCTAIDSIYINIVTVDILNNDTSICTGSALTLQGTSNTPNVSWSTTSLNTGVTPANSLYCTKDSIIDIQPNQCFTLISTIPNIKSSTHDYAVKRVTSNDQCFTPYVNPETYSNPVLFNTTNIDDRYSDVIPLPFSFPFYDDAASPYNAVVLSSNGFLTFDLPLSNNFSHWDSRTNGNVPSVGYDKSLIMGVFHDIDLSRNTSPNKRIKTDVIGVSPHRKFIYSIYKAPLYSTACENSINNTHQIALHEGTGIIEVFAHELESCISWNDGREMIGLQNANRNKGIIPPGRGAEDNIWGQSAIKETWRFTPSAGNPLLVNVGLYDLAGNFIANGDTVYVGEGEYQVRFQNVCPAGSSIFLVKSTYRNILNPNSFVYNIDTIRLRSSQPLINIVTPSQSTTYYLTATTGNTTCQDSVRVNVTNVNSNPIPQDTIRLCGTSQVITAAAGYTRYTWSTGAITPSITVRNTGWYNLTTQTGNCFAYDSVYVEFIKANITNNDTTICPGSSVTLNAEQGLPSNLRNGLVGYWPFNGNANDESGNGNHGTVNGATLTSDRFGNVGKAYGFDGVSSFIKINNSPSLNITNQLTLSAWVYFNDISFYNCIISKDQNATDNGYRLDVLSNKLRLIKTNHNNGLSNSAINSGSWIFTTATFNFDTIRFYLNGSPDGIWSAPGQILSSSNDLTFGVQNQISTLQYLNGKIDDIAIYNRALSPQEIQQLYTLNAQTSSIIWSTGANTPSITVAPTQSSTYYLNVTSGNTTCRDSVRVNVSVLNQNPIARDTVITCGNSFTVTAASGYTRYNWSNGSVTPSTTARATGWYKLTAQTGSCIVVDSIYVKFLNANIANNDTTICQGQSVTLNAEQSGGLATNLRNGLIGYWPFNGNANDESGNGYHGTVNGATLTSDRFGNTGLAYKCENGEFINFPAPTSNTFSNVLSYSMWYKEIPSPDYMNLFIAIGKPLLLSPGASGIRAYDGNSFYGDAGSPDLQNNSWKHIVVIYQGQIIKIFINGVLVSSGTTGFDAVIQYPNTSSAAGGSFGGLYRFYGQLDDIAIYNRALSPQEVQQLYTSNAQTSNYTWSTGATTPSITVTPTQSTTYFLTVSEGNVACQDSVRVNVINTTLGMPSTITGNTDACASISRDSAYTYTIRRVLGAASYQWSVPAGASIVSGQGDTSVRIKFSTTYNSGGNISVSAISSCGNASAPRTLSVRRPTLQTPLGIQQSFIPSVPAVYSVCGVNSAIYRIARVTGATGYQWSLRRGLNANIVSINGTGINDTAIQINFQPGFVFDTISVRAISGCAQSAARTFVLNTNYSPTKVQAITTQGGNFVACIGTPMTLTAIAATPLANQSALSRYSWTLPTGAFVTATTPDSATITINFNQNFRGGTVSVKGRSACSNTYSASTSATLKYYPPTPLSIVASSGTYNACIGDQVTYSVLVPSPSSSQTQAARFRWTRPLSTSFVSATADSSSVTVRFNANYNGGRISVRGITDCGTLGSNYGQILTHNGCAPGTKLPVTSKRSTANNPLSAVLYPNPTTTQFKLQFSGLTLEPLIIKIMDVQGRLIESKRYVPQTLIEVGKSLLPGQYLFEVRQGERVIVLKGLRV